MNCPSCELKLPERAGHCAACGFSIDRLTANYGAAPVVLHRMMDVAGVMRRRERLLIEDRMDGFERRFPQLFFAVYVGTLPPLADVREFGFWLLNRAAVSSVDFTRPNDKGLLLVIDVAGRRASLSAGYFLEPYLSDGAMAGALKKGASMWEEGRYGEGVELVMASVERQLRRAGRGQHGGGGWASVRVPPAGDELEELGLGREGGGGRLPTWRDL
jgi:uncharacterized membrane protein YgcG